MRASPLRFALHACAAAVLLAVAAVAPGIQAQSERVGTRDLKLVADALVGRAFPGASLDWERGTITLPEQKPERFVLPGFVWRAEAGEILVLTGMELTDRLSLIRLQLGSEGAQPLPPLPCRIAAMRMREGGEMIAYREAVTDIGAQAESCYRIEFAAQAAAAPEPAAWPRVLVSYISLHQGRGWTAEIHWAAVLDTDTMAWRARVPIAVRRRVGAMPEFFDYLGAEETGPEEMRFYGKSTAFALRRRCLADLCKVPAEAVLEAATAAAGQDKAK